jgi:hypothetical protein
MPRYGRRSGALTLHCSPAIKAVSVAWWLLPLVADFAIARLIGTGAPVVQEGRIPNLFVLACAGCWMLLGLGVVPFLGVRGQSLVDALVLIAGWSLFSGAWTGPALVALIYRPAPSAVGEPVEFAPNGVNRGVLSLRPTSGDAASAEFTLPPVDSPDAYARAAKPVKGRVYRGGSNLWFARLD